MISPFKFWDSEIFPKYLQFETNTACTSHCTFCPHDKMKKRDRMPDEMIDKIIEECVPLVREVCPFLMQDPALESRMPEILHKIKMANLSVATTIYTPMSRLKGAMMRRWIDCICLDRLVISFYGPTSLLTDKYQPGVDWRQTKKNIRELIDYRTKLNRITPKIVMHYIAIPELMDHLEDFKAEWGHLVDNIFVVHYDTFHGQVEDLGDEEKYFGPAATERYPCPRLWSTFNIHSNGNVVPCCIDYDERWVCGNMAEKSAVAIWCGDELQQLRQLHIDRKFDEIMLCADCGLWKREHPPGWNKLWEV